MRSSGGALQLDTMGGVGVLSGSGAMVHPNAAATAASLAIAALAAATAAASSLAGSWGMQNSKVKSQGAKSSLNNQKKQGRRQKGFGIALQWAATAPGAAQRAWSGFVNEHERSLKDLFGSLKVDNSHGLSRQRKQVGGAGTKAAAPMWPGQQGNWAVGPIAALGLAGQSFQKVLGGTLASCQGVLRQGGLPSLLASISQSLPSSAHITAPLTLGAAKLKATATGAGSDTSARLTPPSPPPPPGFTLPDESTLKLAQQIAASAEVSWSGFIRPVDKVWEISSGFGPRWGRNHNGVDLAAPTGEPVLAADDGEVTYAGWEPSGFGYLVEITHKDGWRTLYGHNSKLHAWTGRRVKRGECIALVGETGKATGPHLHWEIRKKDGFPVDPAKYVPL